MDATSLLAGALSSTISSMLSPRISQKLMRVGVSESQLVTIQHNFRSIQFFLEDICNKQGVNTNTTTSATLGLNHWPERVNDLIFDVENTIDEYESEILRRKNTSFKKTCLFSLAFRMSRKIKNILTLLDELQKEASRMATTRSTTSGGSAVAVAPYNHDTDRSSMFVGRDNDEHKIVQILESPSITGSHIFTIAIVGIAGIGKTTLAKRVYRNEIIQNYFGKKFWVVVGEVFDTRRILKEMLQQALPEEMVNSSEYESIIMTKLRDSMRGTKTLIVLDDVCCVIQEQLIQLYSLQSDGGEISILVTSKTAEYANIINASYTHQLQRLSDEESRHLFTFVAYGARPVEEVCDLETVGRMIIDECCGVPGVIWKLAASLQDTELILSTLAMSFSSLSKPLRRCFAYCCIFPKNAIIRKSDLIRLWLAQGFLCNSEEAVAKSSVEAAEEVFDILLNKSLLQVSNQDEDGNVMDCTMHNLAYELAIRFSKHDVQHLVIEPGGNMIEAVLNKAPPVRRRLRTIYSMVELNALQKNWLSQARSLYVLKLDGIGLIEVPKNISKLKLLRYLDLSNNPIKYLPESITHLYLLQTLLLTNCNDLSELPLEGLNNLPNLTLLDIPPLLSNQMVSAAALRIQRPIKLEEEGEASTKFAELGQLTDIAGPLRISGLEYANKEAAQKAKIGTKHGLSALELCWNRSEESDSSDHDENVLDSLQPHPNIRRLKFTNYDSQKFPVWVMRMKGKDNKRFNRLVKIELMDCKRCLKLPTMGQLSCLRELMIAGMENIENIGPEFYKYGDDDSRNKDCVLEVFFPALTRLELRNLGRLKKWLPHPRSETNTIIDTRVCQAFPSLETLQLINCPVLDDTPAVFPRLKNLVIQEIQSKRWLETLIKNSCMTDGSSTLTTLALSKVSELTRLPKELFRCSSLEKLSLQKCQHFNSWSVNSWNLISLKELCIDDCCCLSSFPDFHGLTALNILVISGCRCLTNAPENLGMCTSLTKLAITNCINLKEIPNLQQLIELEELDILDCIKMKSLPEGLQSLPKLRTMRVGGVRDRFNRFPECKSLERLWLKDSQHMTSLPTALKRLQQLKVLRIKNFVSLQNIPGWICNLKNLGILIIEECDSLKQLPARKKMMRLKKLRCLRIENCATLEERFDKEFEWKKIEHVPHIKIKNCWIEGDRSTLFQEIAEQNDGPTATNLDEESDDYFDANEDESDAPAPPASINANQGRISYLIFSLALCVFITLVNSFILYWTISKNYQMS